MQRKGNGIKNVELKNIYNFLLLLRDDEFLSKPVVFIILETKFFLYYFLYIFIFDLYVYTRI